MRVAPLTLSTSFFPSAARKKLLENARNQLSQDILVARSPKKGGFFDGHTQIQHFFLFCLNLGRELFAVNNLRGRRNLRAFSGVGV